MAVINHEQRRVNIKIVYYGCQAAGKATTMRYLHRRIPERHRTEFANVALKREAGLAFSFYHGASTVMPEYQTWVHVLCILGPNLYEETRRVLLNKADGIIFVAHSQRARMLDNQRAIREMLALLEESGRSPGDLPVALQYHKRDLPRALPVDEMDAALNPYGWPAYQTHIVDTAESIPEAIAPFEHVVGAAIARLK